jgi:hypothetical protein
VVAGVGDAAPLFRVCAREAVNGGGVGETSPPSRICAREVVGACSG